jgi:hypothetical protein
LVKKTKCPHTFCVREIFCLIYEHFKIFKNPVSDSILTMLFQFFGRNAQVWNQKNCGEIWQARGDLDRIIYDAHAGLVPQAFRWF